ncbi:uncharacterized protein DUF4382 [Marinilabilia salmonicolor]|uniref:DUF4382 domain-containing protein n=1 Tax=Marinilabilia salmonicolor TaxID=989 RepID=UPI000D076C65|nr:DUF4382 domain-containing protein [Marinilabilia salmonicolor]PRY98779.1 uncharacterized protein DUF4382 [Marinilabilia salmonicolor]
MKKLIFLTIGLITPFLFSSCNEDGNSTSGTGTLKLSITDAPIETDGITAVNIGVKEVQYHMEGEKWQTFEGFEPDTFNILELTGGESELLGQFELGAGTYTQLRFILATPEGKESSTIDNPGCYLEFEDGSTQPLFVPSGAQTGYKATGNFTVPVNGQVAVTADFDARKSVVKAGNSGKYILKPTIRLVVDNQAGSISGNVANIPEGSGIMIYAYEDETYTEEEAAAPEEESVRFPNAITSWEVDEEGNYTLAFLAPGVYDLVVVETIDGEFNQILKVVEDVQVESLEETTLDIEL